METTTLAPIDVSAVVNYYLTDAQIEETKAKYAALEATTPAGYEAVRQAIAIVRGTRVGVEKRRVELKAEALAYGRKVDAEAQRLTALIESIETPLVEKKRVIDDEKARIKAEAEAESLRLFNEQIAREKAAEEARLKAIRDAEDARLIEERAALAREREQLAEERRQADAARAEAQAIEDARLATLREQERIARQAEDARLKADRDALDRERRELDAKRLADERAEFERQTKAKAEADALAKIEADKAAAFEREARLAELMPDVKKLDVFAQRIRSLQPPTVKTKQAQRAIAVALQHLETAASGLTGLERQVA